MGELVQPLKKTHSSYAKPVEEVAKHLVERRLEFHRHKLEVETKRAGERLRLVFVAGLSVGKYNGFAVIRHTIPAGMRIVLRHALFKSSFTAARICRFAAPIDAFIVQPAALR